MSLTKVGALLRALPSWLNDTVAQGRHAAQEVLDAQVRSVRHRFAVDGFDEPLATGTLPDPAPMRQHANAVVFRPVFGRLFIDGISARDVVQGSAADCYFLATLAAIAHTRPDVLERAIVREADGTVTVTFQAQGKPVPIIVDADLPRLAVPLLDGMSVYAGSTRPGELWPALVEKAWAAWRGGYELIGHGGSPDDAMAALTGASQTTWLPGLDPSAVAKRLADQAAARVPVTASTMVDLDVPGLVAQHVYAVEGAEQHDGRWYVRLRNPWAFYEPRGSGPNDGAFLLPAETFVKTFRFFTTAR